MFPPMQLYRKNTKELVSSPMVFPINYFGNFSLNVEQW